MAKCLVTGGAGFIGSNLVDMLIERGNSVEVVDNLSTGKYENVHSDAYFYELDISSEDFRHCNIPTDRYDYIFHLAALPRIQPSFKNPTGCHDSNITGTINVLEMAKRTDSRVIYAGSSSVYFDHLANPYAFTKWVGEEYCKMYSKIYGVETNIARFFNVYGPRHDMAAEYATVLAAFEGAHIEGLPFVIYGDGEKRRDFTHVHDVCDGLIKIAESRFSGEIFNFGSGVNYSINEVASMFGDHDVVHKDGRPGEAQDTLAKTARTCCLLNWSCDFSLPEYISDFVKKKSDSKGKSV